MTADRAEPSRLATEHAGRRATGIAGLENRESGRCVIGPCGDPALVPEVAVRAVDAGGAMRVEIALTSSPYGWRVRSWWSPDAARQIALDILAAADPGAVADALSLRDVADKAAHTTDWTVTTPDDHEAVAAEPESKVDQ